MHMKRVKAIVSYDGTRFSGYQIQPGMRTVQLEIDKALVKMHKETGNFVQSQVAGRMLVFMQHGQVIHFDTPLDFR